MPLQLLLHPASHRRRHCRRLHHHRQQYNNRWNTRVPEVSDTTSAHHVTLQIITLTSPLARNTVRGQPTHSDHHKGESAVLRHLAQHLSTTSRNGMQQKKEKERVVVVGISLQKLWNRN